MVDPVASVEKLVDDIFDITGDRPGDDTPSMFKALVESLWLKKKKRTRERIESFLREFRIDPATMLQHDKPLYTGPAHWSKDQRDRFGFLYGCKILEGGCSNEAEDAEFAAMWPEYKAGRDLYDAQF